MGMPAFHKATIDGSTLRVLCPLPMQVQDIVREYSHRFCRDLVRPLQLARVTVALYPSVGDVVSISAHLGGLNIMAAMSHCQSGSSIRSLK